MVRALPYPGYSWSFTPAEDDAVIFDPEIDVAGGCGEESCEVWTEDSEDQVGEDDEE